MKRDTLVNCITPWLLSMALTVGGVGGIATGFYLDVSWVGLILLCCLLCGACALLFSAPTGHRILLVTLVIILLAGYPIYIDSLKSLIFRIATAYHNGYNWPVPNWSEIAAETAPTLGLMVVALIPAFSMSFAICRKKPLIIFLPIALIPLYLCMVLTDTVPAVWCLILLLGSSAAAILTQSVRQKDPNRGNRLTALVLIPTVLASWLLVTQLPRDFKGYTSLFQWAQSLLPQLSTPNEDPGIVGTPITSVLELKNVGPQVRQPHRVMTLKSNFGGKVYLRGQSFDRYDGTSWSNSGLAEPVGYWSLPIYKDRGHLTITPEDWDDTMYIPYYSNATSRYASLQNGRASLDEKLGTYGFSVYYPVEHSSNFPQSLSPEERNIWTQLPIPTELAAKQILRENNLQTPEQIMQYVKNSAEYSLLTGRMPAAVDDFAIWFLKESDTGYCMHFASAATVLLRAAGFPARFVTGYAISVSPSSTAYTVTGDLAHAWVEYMEFYGSGYWKIMDATPGGGGDPRPTVPNTEPTETTQPTQSTAPTESTTPSQDMTESSQTVPSSTSGEQADIPREADNNPLVLLCLEIIAAVSGIVILLYGQYSLRLFFRRREQHTGRSNKKALARWKEIWLYCRLLKKPLPENSLQIAEKARFSQHTVSPRELTVLRQQIKALQTDFAALPPLKRLILRLIWAVE